MTVDEVKEKALKLIPVIGERFRLSNWEIDLTVDEEDPEGMGYQGVVRAYDEYEKAHIILYAENIDDNAELVSVLVHEMVHVLVSPVFRMAELNDGLGNLLSYAAERTTLRVERAIKALGLHEELIALLEDSDEAESS